jgi:hypothetical protein
VAKNDKKNLAIIEDDEVTMWRDRGEPPLELQRAMELYELFLNGMNCEQIYKAYSGVIPYGQILDARDRYNWDKKRRDQIAEAFKSVEERVVKSKMDAIQHLTLLLASAHKMLGDRVQKYLATGDESYLGTLDPSNLKNYTTILQTLNALTDSQKSKDVNVGGVVEHKHSIALKPDAKSAAKLLEMLEKGEIVDSESES